MKMLPESSGAGRRSDAPILRCRRNSLAAYSSGFRRETCVPEHGVWPADIFENKTLYGWAETSFSPLDTALPLDSVPALHDCDMIDSPGYTPSRKIEARTAATGRAGSMLVREMRVRLSRFRPMPMTISPPRAVISLSVAGPSQG